MMKKIIFLFVLTLGSLAVWAQNNVFSAVAPSGQTLYYKIYSTTVTIVPPTTSHDDPWGSFTKPTGDLIIPNTVQDDNGTSYPVAMIEPMVFKGCSGLTSVVIPNSVINIESYAFSGCSSLTSVVIPNSVTSIGDRAFENCSSLTSVVIPNSVTSIGNQAFENCSGLTYVVIGRSVTEISSRAFAKCSNLKTVFWLANNSPRVDVFKSTYMAPSDNLYRLISSSDIDPYGSGDNAIYYVKSCDLVDSEDGISTHIPYSSLPTNFIGSKNGNLVAREIVLTDGQDAFSTRNNSNYSFTADSVTYKRSFTNGNRSTLCLPFSAPVPAGLEVYSFSDYDNTTNTLNFAPVANNSIQAYTPYLVGYGLSKAEQTTCTITATNAFFPATVESNFHPVSSNGMTFKGTMSRTCMNSNNYGYSNGYFVQSANGTPDDHTSHAHVNPFRAYFEITSSSSQQPLPPTLGVEFGEGDNLAIEKPLFPAHQDSSIRYSNDVYDLMGRLVRRNADTLAGLPRGIYIWKGKKVIQAQ